MGEVVLAKLSLYIVPFMRFFEVSLTDCPY